MNDYLFKNTITNGIINSGYVNGSFEEAYLTMCEYLFETETYYANVMDDLYANPPATTHLITRNNNFSSSGVALSPFSSIYYYLGLFYAYEHDIKIECTVNSEYIDIINDCKVRIFTKIGNTSLNINYAEFDSSGKCIITVEYDRRYEQLGIVVSNINFNSDVTFSITAELINHNFSNSRCTLCGYICTNHIYNNHYCECGAYTSVHDYHSPYTWVDRTKHTAICGCGQTTFQGHAVLAGSNICVLCGGFRDTGFVGPASMINANYVSENGSYILPNGVTVLVASDLNAYLEGRLEFYNRNLEVE